MIIKNGKILCMDNKNSVIENGYIKIDDGKISEICNGAFKETELEEIIDAEGGYILPGFIDAHCHLGVWEDSLGFEGEDGNEDTDPATPHLRIIDAVNPLDKSFKEALAAGITGVMLSPGSSNPIAGQMLFCKLGTCRIDDMAILQPAGIKMALGENPKTVYHENNSTPVTRMAIAGIIRDQLYKARRYMQDIKEIEDGETVDFDFKCESLLPLLEGKIPVHFHAHRADDIFTAIRIAKEFSLDFVLVHGTESCIIAESLKNAGVKVIAGPALCDRSKPELSAMSFKAPGILSSMGVLTAITTDHPATPIQYLPICAALAVKEGMDKMEALRAITINAAEICKVDHRIGSLEIGKDADIVVFNGNPLDIMSKVRFSVINGKIAYKHNERGSL